MFLTNFFVRVLILVNILIASISFFTFPSNAQSLNKEENKSWTKKIVDALVPPRIPPTQGDSYCFVMPRRGHNSTNTGKPRFIWDGNVTKVQILQRGSLIWEKEIESSDIRSVIYDGTSPLEKGRYEYKIITSDRSYELNFYVNSISGNLDVSESMEIDDSTIEALISSGKYWDATQLAYSTNNAELINELSSYWNERCKQENNR